MEIEEIEAERRPCLNMHSIMQRVFGGSEIENAHESEMQKHMGAQLQRSQGMLLQTNKQTRHMVLGVPTPHHGPTPALSLSHNL